jgi:ABC-type sulfate/molybdate transport systems ATPase subunit
VALARALALEPVALLLDEPFANLDPASAEVFERVVGSLPGEGTTVIMVTHGAAQARRLAQRLIGLEGGRVAGDRPPAATGDDPTP